MTIKYCKSISLYTDTQEACKSIPTDCIPIQQTTSTAQHRIIRHHKYPYSKRIHTTKKPSYPSPNMQLHHVQHLRLLARMYNQQYLSLHVNRWHLGRHKERRWIAYCNMHRSTNCTRVQSRLRAVRRHTFVSIRSVYIACITTFYSTLCRTL